MTTRLIVYVMAQCTVPKPPVDILCARSCSSVVVWLILFQVVFNMGLKGDKCANYFELLSDKAELDEVKQFLVIFYDS